MDNINRVVAYNVKSLREKYAYSFDKMAEVTGISKAMLCQIEKAETNPSINTLYKISNSLKVSLSSLISVNIQDVILSKHENATVVSDESDKMHLHIMFPYSEEQRFEIFYGEIEQNGVIVSEPHPLGTRENLTVFSGELIIKIKNEEYMVRSKDSISFKADSVHTYINIGSETVSFSNTISYA